MRRLPKFLSLIVTVATLFSGVVRAQKFAPLVDRLPTDTNVLVLVDAQRIRSSPIAEREGWTQEAADRVGRQPVIALPGTRRLAVGASLDLNSLHVLSEVSVMDFGRAPLLDTIARSAGGQRETLDGRSTLWTPTDTYFVEMDANTVAAIYPANRQFAARWLHAVATPAAGPSAKFLRDLVIPDPKAPIVFAMNLEDAVSLPRTMESFVVQPPQSYSPESTDLLALAKLLSSVKGLTIEINVAEKISADAQIVFDADCALLKTNAKPVLIDLISRNGLYLSEINDWNVTVKGNIIRAQGELTGDGLKRLLGLVVTPRATLNEATSPRTEAGPESNLQAKLYASQRYYRSVSRIVDRSKPVAVLSQSAGWLSRDAREIHELPILNVDPDLVRWGGEVSAGLTAMSQLFTEGQARVDSRAASIQFPVGPFSYNNQDSGATEEANAQRRVAVENARNQQRMAANEEKARVLQQSRDVLANIMKQRETIRAQMSQKYAAEF